MAHKPANHRADVETVARLATVGDDLDGARLDQAAAQLFPAYSRARLQDWIRSGRLRLDGRVARQRDRVRSGAALALEAELDTQVGWGAEAMALDILYEDDHLLVINKPAGLVVHPGAGNPHGTLVNALLGHRPDLDRLPRGGIVHRLDKDTSGLLVVAASPLAHASLVAQLQEKKVRRLYLAIVRGCPSGGGTVDAPMGRHPRQRTRMAVLAQGGKAAVTHYRIHRRFAHYTALDVQLDTGRTHQIRVHLAHRGYPLVGDPVYGGRVQLPPGSSERLRDTVRNFGRQALHARQLGFTHPATGAACEFSSPLAPDIENLLTVLASDDPPSGGPG